MGFTDNVFTEMDARIEDVLLRSSVYEDEEDYEKMQRHILYWLDNLKGCTGSVEEALLRNELVTCCRMTGDCENAMVNIEKCLLLLNEAGDTEQAAAVKIYTNCATALCSFGEQEEAIRLFNKARDICREASFVEPELVGALYNNMGVAYCDMENYKKAYKMHERAIDIMRTVPGGGLEQAVAYLNIVNTIEKDKLEEDATGTLGSSIPELIEKAYRLIAEALVPKDSYYAGICRKCSRVFIRHGYFKEGQELLNVSRDILGRKA